MSIASKHRVPDGLRDLMKDLTKEILKEKPTDIYNFAENYFRSRIPQKKNYAVNGFEEISEIYDFSYIKNSQSVQLPVALTYFIIPEGLTILIKDLIKSVLREQPKNLCDFAVEYFRHLKVCSSTDVKNYSKKINYSAYENYFINKDRFLFTPYVTCTCGRTLGNPYADSLQAKHSNSIHRIQNHESLFHLNSSSDDVAVMTNNNKTFLENDVIYSQNYMSAIYIIQKHIRRFLKRKTVDTKSNELFTKNFETKKEMTPLVPQTKNNSDDASNSSASAAVLPGTVSGRETTESSTSEIIYTKTIIENVEVENDAKNSSLELNQSGIGDNADETMRKNTQGTIEIKEKKQAGSSTEKGKASNILENANLYIIHAATEIGNQLKTIEENAEKNFLKKCLEWKKSFAYCSQETPYNDEPDKANNNDKILPQHLISALQYEHNPLNNKSAGFSERNKNFDERISGKQSEYTNPEKREQSSISDATEEGDTIGVIELRNAENYIHDIKNDVINTSINSENKENIVIIVDNNEKEMASTDLHEKDLIPTNNPVPIDKFQKEQESAYRNTNLKKLEEKSIKSSHIKEEIMVIMETHESTISHAKQMDNYAAEYTGLKLVKEVQSTKTEIYEGQITPIKELDKGGVYAKDKTQTASSQNHRGEKNYIPAAVEFNNNQKPTLDDVYLAERENILYETDIDSKSNNNSGHVTENCVIYETYEKSDVIACEKNKEHESSSTEHNQSNNLLTLKMEAKKTDQLTKTIDATDLQLYHTTNESIQNKIPHRIISSALENKEENTDKLENTILERNFFVPQNGSIDKLYLLRRVENKCGVASGQEADNNIRKHKIYSHKKADGTADIEDTVSKLQQAEVISKKSNKSVTNTKEIFQTEFRGSYNTDSESNTAYDTAIDNRMLIIQKEALKTEVDHQNNKMDDDLKFESGDQYINTPYISQIVSSTRCDTAIETAKVEDHHLNKKIDIELRSDIQDTSEINRTELIDRNIDMSFNKLVCNTETEPNETAIDDGIQIKQNETEPEENPQKKQVDNDLNSKIFNLFDSNELNTMTNYANSNHGITESLVEEYNKNMLPVNHRAHVSKLDKNLETSVSNTKTSNQSLDEENDEKYSLKRNNNDVLRKNLNDAMEQSSLNETFTSLKISSTDNIENYSLLVSDKAVGEILTPKTIGNDNKDLQKIENSLNLLEKHQDKISLSNTKLDASYIEFISANNNLVKPTTQGELNTGRNKQEVIKRKGTLLKHQESVYENQSNNSSSSSSERIHTDHFILHNSTCMLENETKNRYETDSDLIWKDISRKFHLECNILQLELNKKNNFSETENVTNKMTDKSTSVRMGKEISDSDPNKTHKVCEEDISQLEMHKNRILLPSEKLTILLHEFSDIRPEECAQINNEMRGKLNDFNEYKTIVDTVTNNESKKRQYDLASEKSQLESSKREGQLETKNNVNNESKDEMKNYITSPHSIFEELKVIIANDETTDKLKNLATEAKTVSRYPKISKLTDKIAEEEISQLVINNSKKLVLTENSSKLLHELEESKEAVGGMEKTLDNLKTERDILNTDPSIIIILEKVAKDEDVKLELELDISQADANKSEVDLKTESSSTLLRKLSGYRSEENQNITDDLKDFKVGGDSRYSLNKIDDESDSRNILSRRSTENNIGTKEMAKSAQQNEEKTRSCLKVVNKSISDNITKDVAGNDSGNDIFLEHDQNAKIMEEDLITKTSTECGKVVDKIDGAENNSTRENSAGNKINITAVVNQNDVDMKRKCKISEHSRSTEKSTNIPPPSNASKLFLKDNIQQEINKKLQSQLEKPNKEKKDEKLSKHKCDTKERPIIILEKDEIISTSEEQRNTNHYTSIKKNLNQTYHESLYKIHTEQYAFVSDKSNIKLQNHKKEHIFATEAQVIDSKEDITNIDCNSSTEHTIENICYIRDNKECKSNFENFDSSNENTIFNVDSEEDDISKTAKSSNSKCQMSDKSPTKKNSSYVSNENNQEAKKPKTTVPMNEIALDQLKNMQSTSGLSQQFSLKEEAENNSEQRHLIDQIDQIPLQSLEIRFTIPTEDSDENIKIDNHENLLKTANNFFEMISKVTEESDIPDSSERNEGKSGSVDKRVASFESNTEVEYIVLNDREKETNLSENAAPKTEMTHLNKQDCSQNYMRKKDEDPTLGDKNSIVDTQIKKLENAEIQNTISNNQIDKISNSNLVNAANLQKNYNIKDNTDAIDKNSTTFNTKKDQAKHSNPYNVLHINDSHSENELEEIHQNKHDSKVFHKDITDDRQDTEFRDEMNDIKIYSDLNKFKAEQAELTNKSENGLNGTMLISERTIQALGLHKNISEQNTEPLNNNIEIFSDELGADDVNFQSTSHEEDIGSSIPNEETLGKTTSPSREPLIDSSFNNATTTTNDKDCGGNTSDNTTEILKNSGSQNKIDFRPNPKDKEIEAQETKSKTHTDLKTNETVSTGNHMDIITIAGSNSKDEHEVYTIFANEIYGTIESDETTINCNAETSTSTVEIVENFEEVPSPYFEK